MEAISLASEALPKVRLHATAVFSILNHFVRRTDRNARVIGTLLGRRNDDRSVEVTDCFGVPFLEKEDELYVAINKEYHKSMYAAQRRVSRKEEIVGWFTTTKEGALIIDNSSLVNDFYSQECDDPIHLVLDANMTGMNLSVRGFVSAPICLGDTAFANMFEEVDVEVVMNEAETTALYHMIYNAEGKEGSTEVVASLPDESESVKSAVEHLLSSIDEISAYVDDVVSGKKQGSPAVGLALYDALSALQTYKQEELSAQLQGKAQDLLMVAYLSSIMKTQLKISDKVHSII